MAQYDFVMAAAMSPLPKEMVVPVGTALGEVIRDNPLTTLILVFVALMTMGGLYLVLQHRKDVKKLEAEARSKSEALDFTTKTLNSVLKAVSKQNDSRSRGSGRRRVGDQD